MISLGSDGYPRAAALSCHAWLDGGPLPLIVSNAILCVSY